MKRIIHKSNSFEDAEKWDIEQNISLTNADRQRIAKILKIRVFGKDCPDVRETRTMKKSKLK